MIGIKPKGLFKDSNNISSKSVLVLEVNPFKVLIPKLANIPLRIKETIKMAIVTNTCDMFMPRNPEVQT